MYIVDEICHYCNVSQPHGNTKQRETLIDYYDLTFVLEGQMIFRTDKGKYIVSKNDAVFFAPGTHRIRETDNGPVRFVSFNFRIKPGMSLPFSEYMHGRITHSIKKIVSAFPQSHLSANFYSKEKCANILNYILYELISTEKIDSINEHIHNIITYVDNNVCKEINLSTVSSYVNLSREYTSALFRKEMGMTLTDYITKQKLAVAKDMILNNEMPLAEVASYVGFENYNYFSHVFKKYFGTSPKNMKQLKK